MQIPLLEIDLFTKRVLNVTVVRHFRDWSSAEVAAIRAGLGNVHTDARYPRYIVIAGQHELDSIMTVLGRDKLIVLTVTHPTSRDELPFDIK